MAQDDNQATTDSGTSRSETYPFVTGTNYTNTDNREYVTDPLSDTNNSVSTDEDATDEVLAARAEVENTRAEISGTIDALKEKLSPATLVAEAKEATLGAAKSAASDAVDSAKEVAHNVVDSAKETAHNVVDTVKETTHNVVDTVKDVAVSAASAVQGVASTVAASVSGAVDSAKTAVTGVAHDAGQAAKSATTSVKEASHSVGHTAKGAGVTIVDIIRANPIPAAITGIGLGWLIMSIRRQNASTSLYGSGSVNRFTSGSDEYGQNNYATSSYGSLGSNGPSAIDTARGKLSDVKGSVTSHASDLASTVSDKASGIASTVSDKASGLASTVTDKASGIASTVSDKASDLASTVSTKASDIAHTVGDKASAIGNQAKDTAQSAVSATGSYITNNPLAAGVIASLLGLGIGLLLPSTDKENELLGETRDRLKDKAVEQFHEVTDKVTNVAQTAFDSAKQTVKDEAQIQGLSGSPMPT